jgi:hypothetical protein
MIKILLTTLLVLGTAGLVLAQTVKPCASVNPTCRAAPEIDPSAATGALALLSGGLLVIRARRKG